MKSDRRMVSMLPSASYEVMAENATAILFMALSTKS
jgi:hypothetical protein